MAAAKKTEGKCDLKDGNEHNACRPGDCYHRGNNPGGLHKQHMDKRDWENPGRCWIDLCEAAKEAKKELRDQKLKELFAQARKSNWTHQAMDDYLEYEDYLEEMASDDEYGGEVIEIPSDPEDWINPPDSVVEDFARTKVTARPTKACKECGCDPCCCWGDVW